jgi:hypothetical protein
MRALPSRSGHRPATALLLIRLRSGRALGSKPGTASQSRRTSLTRPPVADRLSNPDAVLSRTDLRELGLERRAVDAIFKALPVIVLPGYSRPMIRAADYRALLDSSTYRDGERVR